MVAEAGRRRRWRHDGLLRIALGREFRRRAAIFCSVRSVERRAAQLARARRRRAPQLCFRCCQPNAAPRLHTLTSTPAHLLRAPPSSKLGPPPRYVEQPRDHFDASDTKTWQQAYYVNDTFFVPGSNAPVFLCVGGEGPPLDGSVVVASVHCNVAVEWLPATGALMLAVEHRYYGCHNASACPYSAADPQPLKWLVAPGARRPRLLPRARHRRLRPHVAEQVGVVGRLLPRDARRVVPRHVPKPRARGGGVVGARHREARHARVQ